MLRICFFQHWFNYSDSGDDQALSESCSMWCYVDIDHGYERLPNKSTIINFRHLLERHELVNQQFNIVGEYLQAKA
ncbi:MAG: transposase [Gammaproteobacteria bacterium]|nr:MAG: transposase [Gammaproteobacteria bacterium]